MVANNHLENGGTVGGVTRPSKQGGIRSSLAMLQREVARADVLLEPQIRANLEFAVAVRDDPQAGLREKLRATELIEAMQSRGINVAMYLDKAERIEDGQVTDRHEHNHRSIEVAFDRNG